MSSPPGRFEHEIRIALDDGWRREEDERPAFRTEVVDERAGRIVSYNRSPDIPFDRSVNPYRGCEHGCTYCFARPTHAWLGLSPGLDFETRLRAKVNAAERLRAELAAPRYRCAPIAIGTATDAYQPVERERCITRSLVEQLAACSHPLVIVTKSSLVERDIDLLAPMAQRGLAAVYVTITTLDSQLARAWEPRATAPWRRLRTVRRLSEAGIPVGVAVAPLVPFLNEPELEKVLDAAAQAGASSAFYTILRLPWELREVFTDWLRVHYPERAERVLNRLRDMRALQEPDNEARKAAGTRPEKPPGNAAARESRRALQQGRLNDSRFFHRMTGSGGWAQLVALRFELAARRFGLDRQRFALRTDLFVAPPRPSAAPHARPAGPGRGDDGAPGLERCLAQGELF